MNKKGYLHAIGVIEIIFAVIGIIFGLIVMIGITAGTSRIFPSNVIETTFQLFLCWVIFIAYSFFSPAVGVLFLTVSDLIDDEPEEHLKRLSSISLTHDKKIDELNSRINALSEKVSILLNCEEDKEKEKQEQ